MLIKPKSVVNNENGAALFVAVIILLIATFIGFAATQTSTIENTISGNDRLYKVAFHAADGGTETGHELLEENISCPTGFHGTGSIDIGGVMVESGSASYVTPSYEHKQFWINEIEPSLPYPTDAKRDVRIGPNDTTPRTNLAYFGNTALSTGSALQMIAGYEGKGFGAAGGGAYLVTEVHSQRIGVRNSSSTVMIHWKHLIGQEGTCRY